jgi:predicted nucleic acid-binding protein
VKCLETSFLIDVLRKDPGAVAKANQFEASGERLSIAAPSLAEILQGAYSRGGTDLREAMEVLAGLEVLDLDEPAATEAGRLGAELLRRGLSVPTVDLLIAATARVNQATLVTRDRAFSRIPDLAVETY